MLFSIILFFEKRVRGLDDMSLRILKARERTFSLPKGHKNHVQAQVREQYSSHVSLRLARLVATYSTS
jgi:hypothetical protein